MSAASQNRTEDEASGTTQTANSLSVPAGDRSAENADLAFPPVTIRTWHDRYPNDTDDRFDENGNEYIFVDCWRGEDRVFDATGWIKRDVADEIAKRWNLHEELLAALNDCLPLFQHVAYGEVEDRVRDAIAKAEGRS